MSFEHGSGEVEIRHRDYYVSNSGTLFGIERDELGKQEMFSIETQPVVHLIEDLVEEYGDVNVLYRNWEEKTETLPKRMLVASVMVVVV